MSTSAPARPGVKLKSLLIHIFMNLPNLFLFLSIHTKTNEAAIFSTSPGSSAMQCMHTRCICEASLKGGVEGAEDYNLK